MNKQEARQWCKDHVEQVIGDYKVIRFSQSVHINHYYCAYCLKVNTEIGFYVPIKHLQDILEEEKEL
jgi:hypothetical protein